jgi:hypothetical protein
MRHQFAPLDERAGDFDDLWRWCIRCGVLRRGKVQFSPGPDQKLVLAPDPPITNGSIVPCIPRTKKITDNGTHYTICGVYLDDLKSFVEHVEAESASAAVSQVRTKKGDMTTISIAAVFVGVHKHEDWENE